MPATPPNHNSSNSTSPAPAMSAPKTLPPPPPAMPSSPTASNVSNSGPTNTSSSSGQPCCETGRLVANPITGHTVCSCQYENMMNYHRLGLVPGMYPAGAPGPANGTVPGFSSSPAGDAAAAFLPLTPDQLSSFYGSSAFDLKDMDAWRLPYPPSPYYPFDGGLPGYFPNGYGMDLNGARRKNATRETTSTLKAWLSDHRKNPYPTKGEKIMLAIITKMTLTQVSTWFANARRRLKKENKMTWSPRNRCDDDEDEAADREAERLDPDRDDDRDSVSGRISSSPTLDRRLKRDEGDSDIVDVEEDSNLEDSAQGVKRIKRSHSPCSDLGSFSDSGASQSGQNRQTSPPVGLTASQPGQPRPMGHPLGPPYPFFGLHPSLNSFGPFTGPFNPRQPMGNGLGPFTPHHMTTSPSLSRHHLSNSHLVTSANSKPRIWSIVDVATSTPKTTTSK